jgi:hypothetical protein
MLMSEIGLKADDINGLTQAVRKGTLMKKSAGKNTKTDT